MDLKKYNLEEKITEMIEDFGGSNDGEAFINITDEHGKMQFRLNLVEEDDSDFNDWDGVPEYTYDGVSLIKV